MSYWPQIGEGPTREEVHAEAAACRFTRNLISAEETEAWLKQRHLTIEAWLAYIRQSLLRQRWAVQLADILSQYPVTDAEVARYVVSEGICSGHFAGFAQKLAARPAIYETVGEASASGASARCSAPEWMGRPSLCQARTKHLLNAMASIFPASFIAASGPL